ncbi:eukaryotic translation initiation factor 4 gamma-like [Dermacentor albipictus]|uniref:eukaryotic translation initiation factor 4 gamma-like n=1 Tax=Dermacentor albipictus TaxID=60249 RepID=UPI0038FCCF67
MAAGAPGYDWRRHQPSLNSNIVGVPKPLVPYTPDEPKSFEPYNPGEPESFKPHNPHEPESFQPYNPDEPEPFQPYNPDEGGVDPLAPYLAESKGDPPENQLLATVAVAILSLICIVVSLLVILELLRRSPAGDVTVREPGEMNVSTGGRGVGQTLIVPQATLRVVPMTAPRREATTGQSTLINAAQTTTEMRTEEISPTTPRTEMTNAQTELRTAAQTTTEMTTEEVTSKTPRPEVTTAQTELTSAAETTTEMTTEEVTPTTPRTEVTTAQTELTSAADTTTEKTTEEITSTTPRTEVTTAQTELTSAAETTMEMTTEEITWTNVKAQTTTEMATEGISPTIVKALHRAPLVCTMGNKTNSTRMFPEDGLCEYIFYDSLYKTGPEEFEPYDLDADVRVFFDARRNFTTTGFGIGFSFRYAYYLKDVFEVATAGTPYMIWYFWRHNITNFGILDTPTRDFNESSVTVALESLKMLDNVSDQQRAKGHMCIIVFAAVIPDDTWENYYVHKFSTIFTPQLFIGLGHYECGDNTFQDCRVVPPTLLSRPPEIAAANSSYQHDMV